ncbi:hypothetical protein MYCTH_2306702 [Thermothelomyces thermophilus ATCC 42464]|uniref:N-acetyltransferase domain-containing protein n=1 Tax=Thermothelomyces thermophilus (strain ATCC 42464 / BCRC 31852 / DSM 1799) TaxID=573729 RepID=G2QHS2_THET4|nr:uncharacterized protein MYCTH_2306702 [Thermothelomyces thermophilus ATCC 42464]AEO58932.1 hypothetical protein MYCTH_2306702 [Thermothelomyces thermophilus ATCC 42464]
MPPPTEEIRNWTRRLPDNSSYTISTDPSLIQLDAINAAFDTDMVYWAKPLPLPALKRCVEQSLCFGLYFHEEQEEEEEEANRSAKDAAAAPAPAPPKKKKMVGLARVVTDYVTFAYLTDVYVLPAHQGRGLGRWLMACLDEVLASWPALRRCMLLTRDEAAVRMYGATIGARVLRGRAANDDVGGEPDGKGKGSPKEKGLFILERKGPGIGFTVGEGGGGR